MLATDHNLLNDPELGRAKESLDRVSFHQFFEEKIQSVTYTLSIRANGDREFIRKGHKQSPRIVACQEQCSCNVSLQFLQQCHHEINEANGAFVLALHDPRHFFYCQVDNQVKRNDKRSILHGTKKALGVSLIANIENPGLVHCPIANVEKPVTVSTIFDSVATSKECFFVTTDEQCCSQPKKTNKTVTFKDLQELFTELIRLALLQGRESTKTLYGAGI
jgi:hypothetical protein